MNPEVQRLAVESLNKGVYKKNIHWLFGPEFDFQEFEIVKRLGGSPGMSTWMVHKIHQKLGVQMQVSKQVSDDLIATDFGVASKVENVPWPAQCVELYFEDPSLPSIVVMKCRPQDIENWVPQLKVGLEDVEYITALMQEGSDIETGKHLSLQIKPSMYQDFLQDATVPAMQTGPLSSTLSSSDNATICYMVHLALKVFAFASIPQYRPAPITRKQMHWGGKAGVKNRPNRTSFKLDYLPKIIHPRATPSQRHEGREFHGRRGHIHWYHSERFVNRKGTWDFIQPVIDPATGKYPGRVIKVRKPKS